MCNKAADETQGDPLVYHPIITPGYRAPALYLSDGTPTFELFGPGYTLMYFIPKAADIRLFAKEADNLSLPFTIVSIEDEHAKSIYGLNLVLLRPDQHVAWRDQALPQNTRKLLKMISGN